ncbi:hypothetical protein CJJ07_001112 [Candidozyma auris]|nr:hypothetical protein CJJ07_001112 [[Candida] auris]QEL58639.1 hypothetical protein CJJ09_000686 [[Candida] auris]
MLRSRVALRILHTSVKRLAKNDPSTIDSYRLPSQTSINEWEFKYDFIPKVAQPKIPPVSPEAVKQDIAQTKKQQVEHELFAKESNSSIKVEANDAAVVHGGESVSTEPVNLRDSGSNPVDISNKDASGTKPKKTANTEKYVQSSTNPDINKPDVVNLGDSQVDHKVSPVKNQERVEDDIEHGQSKPGSDSTVNPTTLLAVLGLGGVAGYFAFGSGPKKETKK